MGRKSSAWMVVVPCAFDRPGELTVADFPRFVSPTPGSALAPTQGA